MQKFAKFLAAAAIALASSMGAQAANVQVSQFNQWYQFDVDAGLAATGTPVWIDNSDGSTLSFTFTVGDRTVLSVVDAGFAGDTFKIFLNNGNGISTSAVPVVAYESNPPLEFDFDAAFANPAYSALQLVLDAGTYTLTGIVDQSVTYLGQPLNATFGAVRLSVPEPGSLGMTLLAIALLIGTIARPRGRLS
jgi:hypothetical protein